MPDVPLEWTRRSCILPGVCMGSVLRRSRGRFTGVWPQSCTMASPYQRLLDPSCSSPLPCGICPRRRTCRLFPRPLTVSCFQNSHSSSRFIVSLLARGRVVSRAELAGVTRIALCRASITYGIVAVRRFHQCLCVVANEFPHVLR